MKTALIVGAVLALHAVTSPSAHTARDDFHWKGRVAAGKAVEIKGVSGAIRALPATGAEVEVTAVIDGDESDVRVQVVEHEDGVTICSVYSDARWTRRGRESRGRHNECEPGDADHMSSDNGDASVEYSVYVPAGVRLIARNVEGDIEVSGLKSDVEAYSVDGDVSISTTGLAQAETVDGAIRVSIGSTRWTEPLEFRTVDGDITVELPAAVKAEVRAETMDGDIESDFPLTLSGHTSRHRLTGTIGGGGPRLFIRTVDGAIRLRKATD